MKDLVEDLKIANDNLYCANQMLEKENKKLNNIIKEVREYIKDNFSNEDTSICHEDMRKILEILDKGE